MAYRGNHSSYSSRSASPDPFADQYDPFDPPHQDPIEMANLSGRSRSTGSSPERRRADSPGISPPAPPIGARVTTRGNGGNVQYAPVRGVELEQPPTIQSGAASLFSLNSLNHYKTMDADTQRLVDRRAGELAEWHIHWVTPAIIIGLFVAGVIAAVGHHLFNVHLDGRPAENQLLMVRYGTALAFFVKSTLVGCSIICYRQRIWHTFRTRAMTIRAIDGLFAATEDPTQFWNWEMMRNGKLATVIALTSWLIPLASVLSPSSLTSEVRETFNATHCPGVATLNFTHESYYDFRHEDSYGGSSLVFYNTTDMDAKDGYFDYYDQPSKNARRLAVTSLFLRKPATNPDASLNACGERWNCTYSINFVAPGYKCDEIANSNKPDTTGAPFNINMLAPQGNYTYFAEVDDDDYKNPQSNNLGDNGKPNGDIPDSLGIFESEPVLWIGHSVKTSETYSESSPYHGKWDNVLEPKIFKCVAHHTNYTFEMRYNDTVQNHKLKHRDFISPVIDTTVTKNPSNQSDFVASPSSNFVSPRGDVPKYKNTAAYHTLGSLLRDFLRGEIKYQAPIFITHSDISETRLLDPKTGYPLPDLMDEIQSVYEDILVSLLSEPRLVIADKDNVPCGKSRSVNVFVYYRQGLWIGYAIAVAATFSFIVVGGWAIRQNGIASDTLFSRILVTTRNPTLDRLSVGACLGSDPFPKELLKTKLRYGVLVEEDAREGPLGRVEHCCFGAAGETKDIVKNGTYAGLKKWRGSPEEEDGLISEKEPLLTADPED